MQKNIKHKKIKKNNKKLKCDSPKDYAIILNLISEKYQTTSEKEKEKEKENNKENNTNEKNTTTNDKATQLSPFDIHLVSILLFFMHTFVTFFELF